MTRRKDGLWQEVLKIKGQKPKYFYGKTKADIYRQINEYKEKGRTISSYAICGTDDVIYKTVDGRECAYVTCSYFIKDGKEGFENTYQCYVLRKDDEGQWKILVYYLIEGETDSE